MRTLSFLLLCSFLATTASGEIPANIQPLIIGQQPVSTRQSIPVTLKLADLTVIDLDDPYPQGFTLKVLSGDNYSVSGQTVTPNSNFTGTLKVGVKVNDGQDDSKKYDLRVTVVKNIKPQITGQEPISITSGENFTMQLSHLKVNDSDNTYPNDFTLKVFDGNNYTLNGTTITPAAAFVGSLQVPVTVNDGIDESNKFNVTVSVAKPANVPPKITGQTALSTPKGTPIAVEFSNLVVTDPDNKYPDDFSMDIASGSNYTVTGQTIFPASDFTGMLSVDVTVNDGTVSSPVFKLKIDVTAPANAKPKITGQLTITTNANRSVTVTPPALIVSDADNNYPADFTIKLYSGSNYTVSGMVVTPAQNFTGALSVKVTVNDGTIDSDPFNLQIQVLPANNGTPQIIGQKELRINEDEMIALEFSHLTVEDKDSSYPTGFTLNIMNGKNYKVAGRTVTPDPNYNGYLLVVINVSDGTNTSLPFNLAIIVNPVNDPPQIIDFETEPISFEPGNDPVSITSTLDITDVDNENLHFAEIGIRPEGYSKINDVLTFTNTTSIRGLYDEDAGILSLIGNASVAEYREAIRSIQYDHRIIGDNDEPIDIVPGPKIIYMNLSDGQDASLTYERMVTIEMIMLDIPTGFTPNGDLANDTWEIRTLKGAEQFERATIKVYNKRGGMVYQTSGFENAWDGTLDGNILPADTYFYTIDLKFSYAEKRYQGAITILH